MPDEQLAQFGYRQDGQINSIQDLLFAIAELEGKLGAEAMELVKGPPPPNNAEPYIDTINRYWDAVERLAWRAQQDPMLREHCEEFIGFADSYKASTEDAWQKIREANGE